MQNALCGGKPKPHIATEMYYPMKHVSGSILLEYEDAVLQQRKQNGQIWWDNEQNEIQAIKPIQQVEQNIYAIETYTVYTQSEWVLCK